MSNQVLYHGAKGDHILSIIQTGVMLPRDGKIYFSKYAWQDSLMHGTDSARKASFVIKVRVEIPKHVVSRMESTPGVPLTFVVESLNPLRAEVLELYARTPARGGFQLHHVIGEPLIRAFLQGSNPK